MNNMKDIKDNIEMNVIKKKQAYNKSVLIKKTGRTANIKDNIKELSNKINKNDIFIDSSRKNDIVEDKIENKSKAKLKDYKNKRNQSIENKSRYRDISVNPLVKIPTDR